MNKKKLIYSGSVKDVYEGSRPDEVTFEFTDCFSVFDWGRMPDTIESKGSALAQLAAHFFIELQDPKAWSKYSASHEALRLRHANPYGADFIEVGEVLQKKGLATHFKRLVNARSIDVQQVKFASPKSGKVLGAELYDYSEQLRLQAPKLIPLEVVFRFGCVEGSSILSRVQKNPDYLKSIGVHLPSSSIKPGVRFDFPLIEVFTKLEPSDRCLGFTEALTLSGLSTDQFQNMMFQTAWVASFIREKAHRGGLDLIDGKIEWGISREGDLFLVDAIGPDELRLEFEGAPLSKEFLRQYYRKTEWYKLWTDTQNAKVSGEPPALSENEKTLASQLYRSLANHLSGQTLFDAWPLKKLAAEINRSEK